MPDITQADESVDIEARVRQGQQERLYERLRRDAAVAFRAMEGWPSVKGKKGWTKVWEGSREEYKSGRFLIERLGAQRYLDPTLMATLWGLRQTLLDECEARTAAGTMETAAGAMLVDLAVLNYYNALRVQQWIGDLALTIEHEFFGQESPTAKFQKKHRVAEGLWVEAHVQRLGEQLMPLLDRASRMVIRNLKAIKELRQRPVPAIAIGRAEQVTVANQQDGTPHRNRQNGHTPTPAMRKRLDRPVVCEKSE